MPANIIIFDAEYISELVSGMNLACEAMSEAMQSFKQASLHEGWKCKECARISGELDDLNSRLTRLDQGVNDTARVLGGSVSRFTSLEASYKSQAQELSDSLTQNHGYTGTIHTEGSGGLIGGSETSSGNRGRSPISEEDRRSRGANGGAISSGGAGVIISGGMNAARDAARTGREIGTGMSSGTGTNVNLPVTHIPDRPEAAAKGIKDTQQIADTAVSRVADTITETLIGLQSLSGAGMAAQSLVETYNAGKSIVENSASIMSNPTMPHIQERLAMAEGIVSLAGSSVFNSSRVTAGSALNDDIRNNAGSLISAMKNVSGGNELSSVLSSFTSKSSEGISPFTFSGGSGGGQSFFEKIVAALRSKLSGGSESSSSGSSSAIDEFLMNLRTE